MPETPGAAGWKAELEFLCAEAATYSVHCPCSCVIGQSSAFRSDKPVPATVVAIRRRLRQAHLSGTYTQIVMLSMANLKLDKVCRRTA
jgi:hypothetical protein